MKQLKFRQKVILWILLSGLITIFSGLIYVVVQQEVRLSANEPQIQIAEDTAVLLNDHKSLTVSSQVNIAESLSPFRIIYTSEGAVISSEVTLDGRTPSLPGGVFDSVRASGEKRFTWQPENSVRIAAVVVPYNDGFVLAGRSLREVEKREDQLLQEVAVVWIMAVGFTSVIIFII